MIKRHVLVLCCAGAATSAVLQQAVERACTENGIEVQVETCGMFDFQQWADRADVVISTGSPPIVKNKPVVQARAFLSGAGQDQMLNEVLGLLRAMG